MKKLLLCLSLILSIYSKAQQTNDPEWMRQMGNRTAKQTWWFFDKRLKEPLDYTFQHVYIEFMNVYIKDIKQLPSGKYQGMVDLNFPHDPSFDENNREVKFDSAEIDDWFMVKDRDLVGGFVLRMMEFNDLKPIKRAGNFNIPFQSINADFIESSKMPSNKDDYTIEAADMEKIFPGGRKGLLDSINAHLIYTDYAHYMGIEGSVTIQFTVKEAGSVADLKVIRGIGAGLSDITKTTFRQLAKYWKPHIDENGIIHPVTFTQAILYRFADYEQTFR